MLLFQKYSLILLFLIRSSAVLAQEKKPIPDWQFHSLNNLGLLEGQTGSSFQLQSINGAQYKTWFTGIGVGLDYYRYRTIPLFLDIRKEFGKKAGKPFIYMDGGINFSWVTDSQKNMYGIDDHFKNGFYTDLGAGYKISMGKRNALLISLGYSNKKLTESYTSYYFTYIDFFNQTSSNPTTKINYSLNRLSLKLGWSF
jgi:hypothetical protein